MAIDEDNMADEAHLSYESGNSAHSTQSDRVNDFSNHLTGIQVSDFFLKLLFARKAKNIFFTVDDQRIQNLLRRKC